MDIARTEKSLPTLTRHEASDLCSGCSNDCAEAHSGDPCEAACRGADGRGCGARTCIGEALCFGERVLCPGCAIEALAIAIDPEDEGNGAAYSEAAAMVAEELGHASCGNNCCPLPHCKPTLAPPQMSIDECFAVLRARDSASRAA
jgi:hypothetical protein